uniref:Nuclear pore complex protein Nup98-Nup96 n=1 Tax=Heterorhabditis bacteriophora TaxID=37862 RepID=A0A1I7XQL5_HETBA
MVLFSACNQMDGQPAKEMKIGDAVEKLVAEKKLTEPRVIQTALSLLSESDVVSMEKQLDTNSVFNLMIENDSFSLTPKMVSVKRFEKKYLTLKPLISPIKCSVLPISNTERLNPIVDAAREELAKYDLSYRIKLFLGIPLRHLLIDVMFGKSTFGSNANTSFNSPGSSGQTNTSGSGTSLFGQKTTSLFGNSTMQNNSFGSSTGGTSLFGSTSGTTGGSLFGSSTSSVSGSTIKFEPLVASDTMMKNGAQQTISTKHMCITAMKAYENKSIEEVRIEDYIANRKTGNTSSGGIFGSASSGGSGLFGNTQQQAKPSLFGASSTTASPFGSSSGGTSIFGNTQNNNASQSFGAQQQPSSSLFGGSSFGTATSTAPATSGGFSFGATNTANSTFGQPASSTGSIFGSSTTATSGLFGKPAGQTGFSFGSTPASGSTTFGQTAGTTGGGLFGNTASKPGGLFGSTTTSGGSLFGNQPAQNTTGSVFGNTQPASQQGSLFGSNTGSQPANILGSDVNQTQVQMALLDAQIAASPYGDSPLLKLATVKDSEEKPNPTSPLNGSNSVNSPTNNSINGKSFLSAVPSKVVFSRKLHFCYYGFFILIILLKVMDQPKSIRNRSSAIPGRDLNYTSSVIPPTLGKGLRTKAPTNFSGLSTSNRSLNGSLINKTIDLAIETSLSGNANRTPVSGRKTNLKHLDLSAVDKAITSRPIEQERDPDELPPVNDSVIGTQKTDRIVAFSPDVDPRVAALQRDQMRRNDPPRLVLDGSACEETTIEDTPVIQPSEVVKTAGGVTLKSSDYYCEPTINAMRDMIVVFRHKEVTVYPDESKKPALGEGLNRPAEVTLERVWHTDRVTKEEVRDDEGDQEIHPSTAELNQSLIDQQLQGKVQRTKVNLVPPAVSFMDTQVWFICDPCQSHVGLGGGLLQVVSTDGDDMSESHSSDDWMDKQAKNSICNCQSTIIDSACVRGGVSRVNWCVGSCFTFSLQPASNHIQISTLEFESDISEDLISDMLEHNIRLSQLITRNLSTSGRMKHCELEGQTTAPRIKPTGDHAQLLDSFLATAKQSHRKRDQRVAGGGIDQMLLAIGFVVRWQIYQKLLRKEESGSSVWSALCFGLINEAIECAITERLHHLASMLSIFSVDPLSTRQDFAAQVEFWDSEMMLQYIDVNVLKVYLVMAGKSNITFIKNGQKEIINCMEDLDWKQALGMHVWWLRGAFCLEDAFEAFCEDVDSGRAASPNNHIYEQLAFSVGNNERACELAIDAGDFVTAHRIFTEEVAPNAIAIGDLNGLKKLCERMEGISAHIHGWGANGQIYVDYCHLKTLGIEEEDDDRLQQLIESIETRIHAPIFKTYIQR